MARIEDKNKALELRRQGCSYSQIKKVLGVGKGTLSCWLRDHPLSQRRMRELRDWNEVRIEKYRETRRKKKEELLRSIYNQEKARLFPISQQEIYVSGLFLYWGEGGKTMENELILSNTNPAAIKAFIIWLNRSFGIEPEKIKIKLHLYADMNIAKETKYWAKELGFTTKQFVKPYIKETKFADLSYKRGFGHGTCNARLCNAIVARKVLMGIRAIEDHFNGLVA